MSLTEIEKLFNDHFHCAVYTAQTVVSSKEVAEDIVQNVFIKLLDIDTGEVKFPVSFLYTCVRNAALDYSRTHAYSLRAMSNFKFTRELSRREDESFDYLPAEEAEQLVRVRQLFHAVEQLPPRTREVVKQVYFHDRSYQETADMLGVSLSTVKSHMYQSFRLLRERLAGLYAGRKRKKAARF
ncbi:sigma-70 family RNA polymerase sigma factor [Alistipes sp.]|uniref:sigma-70 family RNA polymerase sigma factor n=1 Tax=Alistipes sp. TaxID=1872444 RepID=UPI003AF1A02E